MPSDDLQQFMPGPLLHQEAPAEPEAVNLAVGVYQDLVVVNFGSKPITSLGLTPQQARRLARSLFQQAGRVNVSKKRAKQI
jgi:hypothetical protein